MSDEELIEDIEFGRNCEIAKEVLSEFLDVRKARIVRQLELNYFENTDLILADKLAELRVIWKFRAYLEEGIQNGKTAEKELKQDGNESDEEN